MSTLHSDGPERGARAGNGVMSGDIALPYARFNRVRFERCADAASEAIEAAPVFDGVPPELVAEYAVFPPATRTTTVPEWHHGFAAWTATFHHMTTIDGRDRTGAGVPEIPSLADARLVLLSAASDASSWLTFSADAFAEEFRLIAGPDVEVRIMIDGLFGPSLDDEPRYHPQVPADFDMLADPYSVTGLCRLTDNEDGVDNESCTGAGYGPGSRLRAGHDRRKVRLDASCEAFHGEGAPECYNRNHTLFHHVGVPWLALADQEDNIVSDGPPAYADDASYFWHEPESFRARVARDARTDRGPRRPVPGWPGWRPPRRDRPLRARLDEPRRRRVGGHGRAVLRGRPQHGARFESRPTPLGGDRMNHLALGSGRRVAALVAFGGDGWIALSEDDGARWHLASGDPEWIGRMTPGAVYVLADDTIMVFANMNVDAAYPNGAGFAHLRSADWGASWEIVSYTSEGAVTRPGDTPWQLADGSVAFNDDRGELCRSEPMRGP